MNYLEALNRLDALAQSVIDKMSLPAKFRLYVAPRGTSFCSKVDLQHWEGNSETGVWFSVGTVEVDVGSSSRGAGVAAIVLTTRISCTLCSKWSDARQKARGLESLFVVADHLEDYTAGKTFEA